MTAAPGFDLGADVKAITRSLPPLAAHCVQEPTDNPRGDLYRVVEVLVLEQVPPWPAPAIVDALIGTPLATAVGGGDEIVVGVGSVVNQLRAKSGGWDAPPAEPEPAAEAPSELAAAVLDLAALADREPPKRRFAWEPWVPARMVTLLHGYGGCGKTLLLQQIATAYALGQGLFGGATEGRPALVLFGEDDHDEIWRRQVSLCRRLGADLGDLPGKLILAAVPHVDLTVATSTDVGALFTTPMLAEVRRLIEATRPGLIGLDNSAKIFAVAEGDRIAVTRCVGLLNALCQDFDLTAILAAHVNKCGDYSGSTAWENTCRSRLHMVRNDDGTVSMRMPKANYAASAELKLRWDHWSFRADDPALMTYGERLDAEMVARQHGEVFLRALDRLTEQRVNVSDSRRSGNYAPAVMLDHGLGDGLTKRQLERAMVLLLNEARIRANEPVFMAPNRHWRHGLARCGS